MKQEQTEGEVKLHATLDDSAGSPGHRTALRVTPNWTKLAKPLCPCFTQSLDRPGWEVASGKGLWATSTISEGLAAGDDLLTAFPVTRAASPSLTEHLGGI